MRAMLGKAVRKKASISCTTGLRFRVIVDHTVVRLEPSSASDSATAGVVFPRELVAARFGASKRGLKGNQRRATIKFSPVTPSWSPSGNSLPPAHSTVWLFGLTVQFAPEFGKAKWINRMVFS